MSPDLSYTAVRPTEVFTVNVTHNLTRLAAKVGVYARAAWAFEDARFEAERSFDVGVEKALDVFADAVTREQERMSAGGKKA